MTARLTQSEAAERAGMSQQTWQKYESGKRSPGVKVLERIAGAIGIPPGDLF